MSVHTRRRLAIVTAAIGAATISTAFMSVPSSQIEPTLRFDLAPTAHTFVVAAAAQNEADFFAQVAENARDARFLPAVDAASAADMAASALVSIAADAALDANAAASATDVNTTDASSTTATTPSSSAAVPPPAAEPEIPSDELATPHPVRHHRAQRSLGPGNRLRGRLLARPR